MKIIQNSPHFIEKSPVCLRVEGRNIEKSSKKVKISGAKFGNVKYYSYVYYVIMIKTLEDMNLVKLNSVGSIVDIEEKIVYPEMTNGLPDLDMGVEVYETSDEWFEALSPSDVDLLVKVGVYSILK